MLFPYRQIPYIKYNYPTSTKIHIVCTYMLIPVCLQNVNYLKHAFDWLLPYSFQQTLQRESEMCVEKEKL